MCGLTRSTRDPGGEQDRVVADRGVMRRLCVAGGAGNWLSAEAGRRNVRVDVMKARSE